MQKGNQNHNKEHSISSERSLARTIIRKTQSMDSIKNIFNDEQFLEDWSPYNVTFMYPQQVTAKNVASKFSASRNSNSRLFSPSNPCLEEKVQIFKSPLDGQRYVRASSSSRLLGASNENSSVELGGGVLSRGIVMGYISVICLFIVTYKIHHDKNSSPHLQGATHSSSQKLGAAALGSVTSALSPILPFTGGADLRRGEYWMTELLPTGTFDTWDSIFLWGKDLVRKGTPERDEVSASFENKISNTPHAADQSSVTKTRLVSSKKTEARQLVISAPESFLHQDEISKLTLTELADLMKYAIFANRDGFDEESFFVSLSLHMRNAVRVMALACSRSRGEDVKPARTIAQSTEKGILGNIDALQFCAFMRIFAEWRILRQVPEGHKGYAVGMGLGHKDVVQNLVKVETAIFAWMDERKERIRIHKEGLNSSYDCEPTSKAIGSENDTTSDCVDQINEIKMPLELRSPTLYELLQDEVEYNVHQGKLPRLKEKSAAMGLLWVRRQLQYQSSIFANVSSKKFANIPSAVDSAYKEVYDRYHGWAVQKIFGYSFKAAPIATEIYKVMNPLYLSEVLENAKNVYDADEGEIEEESEETDIDLDSLDDESITVMSTTDFLQERSLQLKTFRQDEKGIAHRMNPFEKIGFFIVNEWEKFSNHIEKEVEKILRHIEKDFGKNFVNALCIFGIKGKNRTCAKKAEVEKKQKKEINQRDTKQPLRVISLEGDALQNYVDKHMTEYAHNQMNVYLEVVVPVLDDLEGLFEDLNMNDQTKV